MVALSVISAEKKWFPSYPRGLRKLEYRGSLCRHRVVAFQRQGKSPRPGGKLRNWKKVRQIAMKVLRHRTPLGQPWKSHGRKAHPPVSARQNRRSAQGIIEITST